MKKMLFGFVLLSSFCAHAIELPHVSVKDRVRLELWSFGMDEVSFSKDKQASTRPELRPEIIKPLRDLVLEL